MVDAALIAVLGLDHAGAVGVIVAGEDLGAEFQAGAAAMDSSLSIRFSSGVSGGGLVARGPPATGSPFEGTQDPCGSGRGGKRGGRRRQGVGVAAHRTSLYWTRPNHCRGPPPARSH